MIGLGGIPGNPVADNEAALTGATLYSVGASAKYAFTEKASITGSLEHFWARELARPAFSLPGISTEGWKTILTGTISF